MNKKQTKKGNEVELEVDALQQPRKQGAYLWRISVNDYEIASSQKLQKSIYGYFSSGADDEITLKHNRNAFKNIKIYPRVLVDMTSISLRTKILGKQVDIPFGMAPVAMQKLIHPDGQLLVAKQAYKQNSAYGLSMLSTTKPQQIFQVNPSGVKIHQLYLLNNAEYTKRFVQMVAKSGFHALAVTVDTQVFGKRRINQFNSFNPQVSLEVFKQLGVQITFDSNVAEKSFIKSINYRVTWEDVKKLKQLSSQHNLKLILKGITDHRDVQLAHRAGVDAIWVSNHGGRQLDTSPATIQALPAIRKQVDRLRSKMEVYADGGITKGSDIFKCLALGADYVFLGRGFLYSLIDGAQGIKKAFQILKSQLKTTMMLAGTRSINEITHQYVIYDSPFSRL